MPAWSEAWWTAQAEARPSAPLAGPSNFRWSTRPSWRGRPRPGSASWRVLRLLLGTWHRRRRRRQLRGPWGGAWGTALGTLWACCLVALLAPGSVHAQHSVPHPTPLGGMLSFQALHESLQPGGEAATAAEYSTERPYTALEPPPHPGGQPQGGAEVGAESETAGQGSSSGSLAAEQGEAAGEGAADGAAAAAAAEQEATARLRGPPDYRAVVSGLFQPPPAPRVDLRVDLADPRAPPAPHSYVGGGSSLGADTLEVPLNASTAGKKGGPPLDFTRKFEVTRGDLVVAMPVDQQHLTLAKMSRTWRKGMRTLIASNVPPAEQQREEGRAFNETWAFYPDDAPLRSLYGGDTRASLVPFLAHAAFGDTYKWILYGDDDTVWFVDGVQQLLENLDPDMPYFISDHMWWSNTPGKASHPNRAAPRCLPCNFPDPPPGEDTSRAPFRAPKGCPCTPALLCEADERSVFNEFCDMPRAPVATYSMHGGAGGLMSVGLLRAVSLEFMEACVKSLWSTGGDAFISICLWQAGYGITDPGPGFHRPEVQMFDPGPEDRMGIMMKLVRALDGRCDEPCQRMLDHMVTVHVRSRVFPTLDDAAQFVKALTSVYDIYVETKARHAIASALRAEEAARVAEEAARAAAREADKAAAVAAADRAARRMEAKALEQAKRLGKADGPPEEQILQKPAGRAAGLADVANTSQ